MGPLQGQDAEHLPGPGSPSCPTDGSPRVQPAPAGPAAAGTPCSPARHPPPLLLIPSGTSPGAGVGTYDAPTALCVVLERDNQLPHTDTVSTSCLSIPVVPAARRPCPALGVFVGHRCSIGDNGSFSPAKPRPLRPLPEEQRWLCISFSIYFYKEGGRERVTS